jgi:Ran GTPase-activating protein (RanGAP) involved in mRNA processing and transport
VYCDIFQESKRESMSDPYCPYRSAFLDFCAKVRNNDPSILPAPGEPFKIVQLSETEDTELADALMENNSVTYLELRTGRNKYTEISAEAMANYVRTSKHLQRIRFDLRGWRRVYQDQRPVLHDDEMLYYFLPAIQESTSLKELHMELPAIGSGSSNLAFENMLTHTQSLQSLSLICPDYILLGFSMAAARSGLKKNTTLRELTLQITEGATNVSPILTSLRDHPLLRRLCLRGQELDLTGLVPLLLSENSKITELEIDKRSGGTLMGLTRVLQALARRPTLTKLSLVLASNDLGSAGLAELAPALYRNTSIKVLDISANCLSDMESATLLRDILRRNKTITTLDLSRNDFGQTTGAVECIADGLGSNSTLTEIDLSGCRLRLVAVSILAQTLGSRNTTLQKLTLANNSITSTSVGVLLETMEHNSHITDLDLQNNPIGDEGASLLARSLGNNALPKLTRLSLYQCHRVGNDGFMALVSALEQNTSLLQLDLRYDREPVYSEPAYLALAESLPEIKVLQRVDLSWCPGLASTMPLLLAGLRKNTSLFRFHVANCAPSSVPPTPEETARYAGGWMHEMERLGYRNRFLTLIRAPEERLPPRGVWPLALSRVATLPDVIFEVLRSKSSLVPSDDTEGYWEAAKDTQVPKKRKRGDE